MEKSYLLSFFGRIISLLILSTLLACSSNKILNKESEMTIAFGSCNHHWDVQQPIWKEVVKNSPDLWIWLGDIIYSDTEDMSKMRKDYNTQKANTDYNYLAAASDIIGIWDDHDYGVNNGGKEFSKKDSSKALLLDFLNVPKNNSAWSRKGAYQSYEYHHGELLVKVILLDVRYFRDSIGHRNGTILGEAQWQWLESELSVSKADVHIIGGGIQFLAEDHRFEKWANFPAERSRLLGLIDVTAVANPILISGDRHIAEMALVELPESRRPLLEITSSGLTHAYTDFTEEENRHRIGHVLPFKNFATLVISKFDSRVSFRVELRNEINQIQQTVTSDQLISELSKKR